MTTPLWFQLVATAMFVMGLTALVRERRLIMQVLALNVMSTSVFMILVAGAWTGPDSPPDPIPHALVLTGLVVAVAATALALLIWQRWVRAPREEEE